MPSAVELRLLRRRRHLHRPGRPLLRHGRATDTNGCDAGSPPLGTPVGVRGASRPGTLVYSSWLTMQSKGEADANTCDYNDFALVRLDPADHANVNPSIPRWGGPNALGATTQLRDKVYSYGNSSPRGGVTALSPKEGYSLGDDGGGSTDTVYTATPGIPDDSGSAFLSKTGAALGTLSTVAIAPVTGSNGVGDLQREFDYMKANSSFTGVEPALGTEALPLGPLP